MAFDCHCIHPLLIPSIINEILSYANISELKIARMVCSTWEKESLKYLKAKTTVVFNKISAVKRYNLKYDRCTDRNRGFAYNFRLGPNLQMSSGREELHTFFINFGLSIKSLHFNRVSWTSNDLRIILGEKVPNLEELILDPNPDLALENCRIFPMDEDKHVCPNIPVLSHLKHLRMNWDLCNVGSPMLKELTLMMPHLERLTALMPIRKNRFELTIDDMLRSGRNFIANRTESMPEAVVEDLPFLSSHIILSQLVVSLTGPRFALLKDLDVHMIGSDSAVKKLQAKNLPLEKLDLSPTPNVQLSTLCLLFTSLKNTLTHLRLKYHPNVPYAHSIPSGEDLKKLEYLSLVGFKGSLVILEQLPKLKSLILRRVNLEQAVLHPDVAAVNVEGKQQYGLKILEVHHDTKNYQFCNPYPFPVMDRLAQVCPNLTRLRLEAINNENLRVIFSKLPNIEELVLVDGLFTDLGICGLEPRQHCSVDSHRSINTKRPVGLPYIASLKKLRRLELESPYMTDFSVENGIYDCERLRELVLNSYAITDKSIRLIVSEMKLTHLQTVFCSKITKNVKRYAERKMKGHHVSINRYAGPMDKVEIVRFLKKNDTAKVMLNRLEDGKH